MDAGLKLMGFNAFVDISSSFSAVLPAELVALKELAVSPIENLRRFVEALRLLLAKQISEGWTAAKADEYGREGRPLLLHIDEMGALADDDLLHKHACDALTLFG